MDISRWSQEDASIQESNQFDTNCLSNSTSFDYGIAIRPRKESKLDSWKAAGRKCSDNQMENDSVSSTEEREPHVASKLWSTSMPGIPHLSFSNPNHGYTPRILPLTIEPGFLPQSAVYVRDPMNQTQSFGSKFYTEIEHTSTFMYYEIEFKRNRRMIFLGHAEYAIGSYVKVEADRGHDLGVVVRNSSNLQQLCGTIGDEKRVSIPLKRIMRLASTSEMYLLACKVDEEAIVLQVCREKVRQRSLPMQVIDAEYQFDRHKLTFFFQSDRRIDFRELVRDLFAVYKTRIWLQQVLPHDE